MDDLIPPLDCYI